MPGLAPIPAPGRFSDVLRAISPRATANRSGELDARDVGRVELIQFLKLNPACVPAIDDNIDRREQAYANPLVSDLLLHAEALGRLDRRQSPVVLAGKDIRGKQLQYPFVSRILILAAENGINEMEDRYSSRYLYDASRAAQYLPPDFVVTVKIYGSWCKTMAIPTSSAITV
jgi:hypothetical protein